MTRRALKRRLGGQRVPRSSKGRGGAATRRCLKPRPVLDLGIPSGNQLSARGDKAFRRDRVGVVGEEVDHIMAC